MSDDAAGSPRPHIVAKPQVKGEAARLGVERLLAGRWSLTANGQAIQRSFKFKNFTKTWDFVTSVALQCKLKNHHPEWSNVYTTTYIRWTTHHNGPCLTDKDVELAGLCDELGRAFGELAVEEEEGKKATAADIQPPPTSEDHPASTLQSLADSAADVGACDCSAPREPAKKA
ncbi:hypothetical protein SCUCBS95973_006649 [Sporothrix curviconia]|uniref:4a-hydroxytetrahydrobiopterin dehydratase n=1 Tax=Sporothrix curviconia TaxID=1260050 RepID=A0ABP0C9D3_9PEZI